MDFLRGATLAMSAYQAFTSSQQADEYAGQSASVARGQLGLSRRQQQLAEEDRARYLELYDPLERELVAGAREGVDPERYIETAQADIGQQFGVQRENMRRQAESYGLRPDMRPGAERSLRISEALGKAGAANRTRMAVDDINWNRRMNVAGLGRNLPAQAQAGMSSAANTAGAAGAAYGNLAGAYGNDAAAWTRLGLNLYDRSRVPPSPEVQQNPIAGPAAPSAPQSAPMASNVSPSDWYFQQQYP